jgi:hypothetical protein
MCDWCAGRAAERDQEVDRLEQLWALRVCDGPDCQVIFKPKPVGQRFCCDRCWKRSDRRTKTAV